ncbi:hypothetical protein [Winogradskyella schleiferi]|uniref:hypothetical protein n=1 Tax=Winogradskyella schleiferi TaxID=2686078 RepID=UPI0015C13CC7|nr:hypothetical protein [Winogradskyella schleiferi]
MKKIAFTLTFLALCSFSIFAQNQNKTELLVKVKEDKKPLIFVDGKKFDFSMDLIDQSTIESVNVIKGEEAEALYNTSNGVILITTNLNDKMSLSVTDEKSENQKKPIVIIDGEIASQAALEELEPQQIEKVEVLKGEQALEKYNSPNGVIIITTKKE